MALTRRVPNWDHHLRQWAAGLVDTPFVWGRTDCHALARTAVEIMYGHEAARLPRWRTREEAFTLHNNGQGAEAWLKQLGATAESMNFAQPGDIVIEPARRRKSPPPVMVHLGHGMLLTASPVLPRIVMYVRDRDVRRDAIAWRLPHG